MKKTYPIHQPRAEKSFFPCAKINPARKNGFTIDCAGYVICPANSEWQITLAYKPRLRLFRMLFEKHYLINL